MLAASVIQIGGSSARLLKELYPFISTAAQADQDITTITKDVDTTSNDLVNVGRVLEADAAGEFVNQEAVKHTKDLMQQCEEVFEGISSTLKKRRKSNKMAGNA